VAKVVPQKCFVLLLKENVTERDQPYASITTTQGMIQPATEHNSELMNDLGHSP
jgi:hypothetical protein